MCFCFPSHTFTHTTHCCFYMWICRKCVNKNNQACSLYYIHSMASVSGNYWPKQVTRTSHEQLNNEKEPCACLGRRWRRGSRWCSPWGCTARGESPDWRSSTSCWPACSWAWGRACWTAARRPSLSGCRSWDSGTGVHQTRPLGLWGCGAVCNGLLTWTVFLGWNALLFLSTQLLDMKSKQN